MILRREVCFTVFLKLSRIAPSFTLLPIHSGLPPKSKHVIDNDLHVEQCGRFSSHFFLRKRQVQQPYLLQDGLLILKFACTTAQDVRVDFTQSGNAMQNRYWGWMARKAEIYCNRNQLINFCQQLPKDRYDARPRRLQAISITYSYVPCILRGGRSKRLAQGSSRAGRNIISSDLRSQAIYCLPRPLNPASLHHV